MRWVTRAVMVGSMALAAGCGGGAAPSPLDGARPIGRGPGFELPSLTPTTTAGRAVGALGCDAANTRAQGWAHVELFARGKVVLLPPGIGIAPPRRAQGAYVQGGRCRYPLWTDEPTGLVALAGGTRRPLHLRDLFAVWGRDLSTRGAAGFKGRVTVHVDGHRHTGDPGTVRLRPHAQVVLQVGGPRVPPHASYTFPGDR